MFGLSTLATRIVAALSVLLLIVGVLYLRSCQEARQRAAESRLQRGQAGALSDSAADAIGAVQGAAARERAEEELTRRNEREIRDAPGASDAVNPAVRDAGLASLCRRAAYRDSERCRLRGAPPG